MRPFPVVLVDRRRRRRRHPSPVAVAAGTSPRAYYNALRTTNNTRARARACAYRNVLRFRVRRARVCEQDDGGQTLTDDPRDRRECAARTMTATSSSRALQRGGVIVVAAVSVVAAAVSNTTRDMRA